IRLAVVVHEHGGWNTHALLAATVLQYAGAASGPDTHPEASAPTGPATRDPAVGAGLDEARGRRGRYRSRRRRRGARDGRTGRGRRGGGAARRGGGRGRRTEGRRTEGRRTEDRGGGRNDRLVHREADVRRGAVPVVHDRRAVDRVAFDRRP